MVVFDALEPVDNRVEHIHQPPVVVNIHQLDSVVANMEPDEMVAYMVADLLPVPVDNQDIPKN